MKIFAVLSKAVLLVLASAFVLFLLPGDTSAQICPGSHLRYVVRDGKGRVIDPTGVYQPEKRGQISELKDAEKVIKGAAQPSIRVVDVFGMCNFREPVHVALKLKGKEMNLIFLMPRFEEYESRNFMVDSIPYKAGTFEINLAEAGEVNPGGARAGGFYPAKRWKPSKMSMKH
jgi:hypothetical protein